MRLRENLLGEAGGPLKRIDYYFASRLQGEPLDGVDDIHARPTPPRTARVSMVIGF
jgi:hypothetical protein